MRVLWDHRPHVGHLTVHRSWERVFELPARLPGAHLQPSGETRQRFRDLKVWQRSHALVLSLYPLTATLPASERFGLVSQLRRAVVSVPANIAEGSKRQGRNDFAHFLNIAEGSLAETEYLLTLVVDLGYVPQVTAAPLLADIDEIAGMLYALRTRVEREER